MSTVSPCTTAPAGDTMIVDVTGDSDSSVDGEENGRDEVFFLRSHLKLHAKPLYWVPACSSPKPFFDQLLRSTVRLQRSLAKVHVMESLLSTTECRKSTKNSFQASRSGPLRAAK